MPSGELFVQNFRVAQATGPELDKIVSSEAAGRLPFAGQEAEIRYLEAADVRQGDVVRREVIVLACRRAIIDAVLAVAEGSGLQPLAIDVPPAAILRCYGRQFRRDEDQQLPMMLVNLGALHTAVVIARVADAMFVKYVDVGGQQLDQAVARSLKMGPADAAALRRHNGDRRADQRDPEVTRSIAEAVRPELQRLTNEISIACATTASPSAASRWRGSFSAAARPTKGSSSGSAAISTSPASWATRCAPMTNPPRPAAAPSGTWRPAWRCGSSSRPCATSISSPSNFTRPTPRNAGSPGGRSS